MLSILIPVYNYDVTFLIQKLHCQLQKRNHAYEILIQDDCSVEMDTHSSNKKLEQYPNCFYFASDTNQGRISTRLNLAKKAKFDWLLFLDADVMPKYDNFISDILKNINEGIDLIFGGISYQTQKPKDCLTLRWKYGIKKEIKNVTQRTTNPYTSIISQNFVIRKKICLEILKEININRYGLDIYFAYELEKRHARILHINNPTIHLGLENNSSFLKKSLDAIETTLFLQENQKIPMNYRPIQRSYTFIKSIYLTSAFFFIIQKLQNYIINNIRSNEPCLFLFDLYRMYYFIKIQKR